MDATLTPALLPIVLISLALAGGVRARSPERWGLFLYCLGIAAWAWSVFLAVRPESRAVGERLLMVGFLVPAGFVHTVLEDLDRSGLLLERLRGWEQRTVAAVWGVAVAIAGVGLVRPELFLLEGGTQPGPAFAPMFLAAAALSSWPLLRLLWALREAPPGARERLSYLLLAGFLCTYGGGINVLQMLTGHPSPAGLYLVLGSLVLLAWVVQAARLPTFGRFVQHSLRYSVLAALLSTGFLFGVMVFLAPEAGADVSWSWDTWSGALLVFLVVLAGQPLLAWARGGLAARFFPGQGDVEGMARALAESEARAEHAARLAEVGALASAVAHEVRNPLGVITAASRMVAVQARRDPELAEAIGVQLAEIQDQVDRASRFADELLEYGRPAPLSRREVALLDAARVAVSEVERAQPLPREVGVEVSGEACPVSGDLSQLIRLVGILVENARLAVHEGATAEQRRVRVCVEARGEAVLLAVEDSGPGVPAALRESLFQPFVSGRGRDGPRPGTGLGLAIARGIAERHGGALSLSPTASSLGGARFEARLPRAAPLPAGS